MHWMRAALASSRCWSWSGELMCEAREALTCSYSWESEDSDSWHAERRARKRAMVSSAVSREAVLERKNSEAERSVSERAETWRRRV
jgi:hypothetical protein